MNTDRPGNPFPGRNHREGPLPDKSWSVKPMRRFKIYPAYNSYFTTCTIISWLTVFSEEKYFQIIIDSLKYCIAHKGLYLLGYVIMPSHLHLLTANAESTNLSNIMRDFKPFTSTRIAEELALSNNRLFLYIMAKAASRETKQQNYKVWKDDFHPEVLRSEEWFGQKLQYMHLNPVRKGFVIKPEDWKYSSARNWLSGDESIISINYEYWHRRARCPGSGFRPGKGFPGRSCVRLWIGIDGQDAQVQGSARGKDSPGDRGGDPG